jgi:ABC-type transport system involved in multi-copper enzyme maturation permease subunit
MATMNDPSMTRTSTTNPTDVNVNTAVITPTDRVRWGPIIAGLFAALSLLALLSILGVAVGLSSYDPGDDMSRFRVGAGVWGAISMLLAFFFGGWLTARTAALRGTHNGLLNGALVWAVAIPLMAYILTTGAVRMADTAANVADRQRDQDQVDRVAKLSTGNRDNTIQSSSSNPDNSQPTIRRSDQISNQDKERAASTGSKAAWGTLVSMLLGLGAAAAGGAAGARDRHHHSDHHKRDRDSGYVPAA